MKNQQKIKRIHLPVDDQDIPVIIGIVSSDQDYKLTLKINKKLSISLKNTDPVAVDENKDNIDEFSRFTYSHSENIIVYQLISNRTGKSFLIKKLKNIDYLMLVNDAGKSLQFDLIMTSLRDIDSVSGVFRISFDSIAKDRNTGLLF